MKQFLLALCGTLLLSSASAQTIVYHETFDPADSIVSSGNPTWLPDATLQTSGLLSMKNPVALNDTSWLTTNAFNTTGNFFVILNFNQICKIDFFDKGQVQVSNDNGTTWTTLTSTQYMGTGVLMNSNAFNSNSYPADWQPMTNNATPANSWWKNETFDISAYCSNAAQCKVRFKLSDGNGNGAFTNYGWVIDDVIVTASASELVPPTITLLAPIYTGTVYSMGPFAVNATITDNSGIASATVEYTVNGGSLQSVPMSLVSGNDWLGTIPVVTDSDTVCYYVHAIDASPNANSAQAPSSGCQQFITSAGITFPYFNDFENDTMWTTLTPQPGNPPSYWELGMPSYGTTNSTHSGVQAWDVNLDSAYSNSLRTALISPIFDFSNAVNAKLSFWHNYNCEGGWDGTRLDYTTDGVTWQTLGVVNDPLAVNWYDGIINATGLDAWNGNSNGWIKSEYELSILNNVVGPVQFRFLFASDASVTYDGYTIDDFAIVLPSPQDAGILNVVAPDITSCLPVGSVPLSVSLKNYGTQNINGPMSISYVLDANPAVNEMYLDTLVPAAIDTFTFATPLNNTAGTHTLTIYTGLTSDGFLFNDTLTITYTTAGSVNVPYFNGFENGPSSLTDFCVNVGTYGRADVVGAAAKTGVGGLEFDATSSAGWMTFSDTITTSPNYIWLTATNPQNRANARLIVNTTGYTDLVMEFDAKLLYQYDNSYTNFRVKVNGQMITPHLQPNYANTPYDSYRYMLSSFLPAPYLTIDFEAKTAYDYISTGNGTFMDNLYIYQPDTIDAGTMAITNPGTQAMAGSSNTVKVTVRNYGLTTLLTMPISYQVNSNTPVTETWNGSLAPNATMTYTFTTPFNAPTGQFSLCAWTGAVGDIHTPNDTTCKTVTGLPVVVAPLLDDFEGANNFAVDNTYSPSWQLGTPVAPNITGAHSGSNAWEVNLNGNYQLGGNEILYSPFIDMSNVQQAELRFYSWINTDMYYDGGHVEYSTDGGNTWTVLGTNPDPNGYNWYNYFSVFANNLPGFTGQATNYVQARYKLNMLNNFPTPVQFRFILASSTFSTPYDGWGVDDFEIWVPVNAATNTITLGTSSQFVLPGTNTIKANIKNAGLIALSSVDATLNIDGVNIVTDNLAFNPTLNIGQSVNHTFSLPWLNAAPGPHVIKVWTSNPNGLTDTNLPDDTTTWALTVFDTVSVYPYCNDFENGNGNPVWPSMNAQRYVNAQNDFELGTPGKNVINTAHSGSKCWITKLTGNYLANDTAGLFSPVFDVQTGACYNLSFWHNYQTPIGLDGGSIEYTTDLGQTWQTLGQLYDPSWYNVTSVAGLGAGTDGFSGNSNYWVQTGHLVSFNQNGNVVFRFRFGSDNSVQSEGWAIDDVCFEEWLSPCASGIQELSGDDLQLGDNVPNPATQVTSISYNLPTSGDVTITLRDLLGRELQTYANDESKGQHELKMNVASLPDGVYFYTLSFNGVNITKKMVISRQ